MLGFPLVGGLRHRLAKMLPNRCRSYGFSSFWKLSSCSSY